jgi:hypothetical protein
MEESRRKSAASSEGVRDIIKASARRFALRFEVNRADRSVVAKQFDR